MGSFGIVRSRRLATGIACVGLAALAWRTARGQSESASFILQQSTRNSAGSGAASAGLREHGSLGQESSVGTSSSAHFVIQSGFWSFLGSGLVPVVLYVQKNTLDPTRLDLQWTGNDPPYILYRSTDCTNVFASFFGSETTNARTDPSPQSGPLSCYNVLGTAPGPITSPRPAGAAGTRDSDAEVDHAEPSSAVP